MEDLKSFGDTFIIRNQRSLAQYNYKDGSFVIIEQSVPREQDASFDFLILIDDYAFDENGYIYIIYKYFQNKDVRFMRILDIERNIVADNIPFDYGDYESINSMGVFEQKIYISGPNNEFYIYNLDGTKDTQSIVNSFVTHAFELFVDPFGALYVIGIENIAKIDLTTLSESYRIRTGQLGGRARMFYDASTDTINIATARSVMGFNRADGKGYAKVFEYKLDLPYLIGDGENEYVISGVASDSDGNFYFALVCIEPEESGFHQSLIHKLSKTPGVRPEQEYSAELTVTALYKPMFLDDIATRFQVFNPHIGINWDVLYETIEAARAAISNGQAAERLTAKMLANDIGDIVALGDSGIDIGAALQTDLFIDLSQLLELDANYNHFNKSVIDAMKKAVPDGQIKAFPLTYTFDIVEVDLAFLDRIGLTIDDISGIKVSELVQLAIDNSVSLSSGEVFFPIQWQSFLRRVALAINEPDLLVGGKVDFSQDWLLEFAELFRILSRTENSNVDLLDENGEVVKSFVGQSIKSPFQFSLGDHSFAFDLLNIYGMAGANNKTVLNMFEGEINRNLRFYPRSLLAITSKSANHELAFDFLSFAADSPQQKLRSIAGTPINLKALRSYLQPYLGEDVINEAINLVSNFDVVSLTPYDRSVTEALFNSMLEYVISNGQTNLEELLNVAESDMIFSLDETRSTYVSETRPTDMTTDTPVDTKTDTIIIICIGLVSVGLNTLFTIKQRKQK